MTVEPMQATIRVRLVTKQQFHQQQVCHTNSNCRNGNEKGDACQRPSQCQCQDYEKSITIVLTLNYSTISLNSSQTAMIEWIYLV